MTSQTVLRPLNSNDELFIYDLLNNKNVIEYGFLTYMYPQSDMQIKDKLNKWLSNQKSQKSFVVSLENAAIGLAQIHSIDYLNRKCSFGITIHPEYQLKGYGSQVMEELIQITFKNLNLNKVEVEIIENNKGSIKMVESFNFKHEGVREHSIFKNGKYHNLCLLGLLNQI